MRTLEISAQFLALVQIPHATLRRSLHLSVLHFPSAKFGERDAPSGLVLGREQTLILFPGSAGERSVWGRCRAVSPAVPSHRLRGFSEQNSPQISQERGF